METSITRSDRLTALEVLEDVAFIVLLDASSSMEPVETATRDSANAFIAELQSGTPVTFSLASFATTVRWAITETSVDLVRPLSKREYSADGMTALYDALGEAINRIEAMDILPVHPVIAVFTDGEDISSRKFSAELLKPMINERRKRGWRFIAFVAGNGAHASAEAAGFLSPDIAEYAGDSSSTRKAFQRLAASAKRLVAAVETKALPPPNFL